MPQVIDSKKLTAKEHSIWKAVFDKTADGARATGAVQRFRAKHKTT